MMLAKFVLIYILIASSASWDLLLDLDTEPTSLSDLSEDELVPVKDIFGSDKVFTEKIFE